jgi:aspartyl-tRNA(Asn)/glutamyl-tRNA(Gln) amidotransferase subunit C
VSEKSHPLSAEAVEKLVKLSALDPLSEDIVHLRAELEKILGHVDILQSVNVADVDATSHASEALNVFREDRIGEHLAIGDVLGQAPDSSGRYIRVPLIIEG